MKELVWACVLASWLAALTPAFAGELDLALTVTDNGNVQRTAWPVCGGVPFPKGCLNPAAVKQLAVFDKSGKPVPFQEPLVLGTWKDGSVRWALLDFAADVPAGGQAVYNLRKVAAATAPTKAPALKVAEDGATYTVDTGALKVVLNKNKFSFIDKAWIDANGDGAYGPDELVVKAPGEMFIDLDDAPPGPVDTGIKEFNPGDKQFFGMEGGNWLRDSKAEKATRYTASSGEYKLELFRKGTLQTVFRMEGFHKNAAGRQFGKYTLYFHFYAGQSFMRVLHTWIMTGDPEKNFIRRMGIEVPVAGKAGEYAFGGEFEQAGPLVTKGPSKAVTGPLQAGEEAYIVSVGPDKYYHNVPRSKDLRVEYKIFAGGAHKASGYSPSGWADFYDGKLGLAAGVRDFYREHPKEIGIKNDKVMLYLWPDHGNKTLDLRRNPNIVGYTKEVGNAARRSHGPQGSAVGVAKTTELFFYFHKGNHAAAKVDEAFRSFEEPLLPFAGGEWNCKTGVWGPLTAYDPAKRPELENFLDVSFHWVFVSQKEFSWYGMLDWGDALLEYECMHWELKNWPRNKGLYSNWGYAGWSAEWDPGQFMLVQYLRSGRWNYFRYGEAKVRHERDVDCVYWEKPDDGPLPQDNKGGQRLGGGHRHDQQHWSSYMVGYSIPSISTGHLYYLTGDPRCLDAYRDIALYHANAPSIENEGRLALAYIGEILGEKKWTDTAIELMYKSGECAPAKADFGRGLVANMMALMLCDIATEDPRVRKKALEWGELTLDKGQADEGMIVLWSYLKSVEKKDTWDAKIREAFDRVKPKDASGLTAQALPKGVWSLPGEETMLAFFKTKSPVAENAAYKPSANFTIAMLAWAFDFVR
jgi:hypothetical protein